MLQTLTDLKEEFEKNPAGGRGGNKGEQTKINSQFEDLFKQLGLLRQDVDK